MAEFLDDFMGKNETQASEESVPLLVVGGTATPEEFARRYVGVRHWKHAGLVVFEDEQGNLANSSDFLPIIDTVAKAEAFVDALRKLL